MILKFQPFEYYRKKDKFASFQNLQSKDFAEDKPFSYLIDGSQNTENETSREQRRSRNFLFNELLWKFYGHQSCSLTHFLIVIDNTW